MDATIGRTATRIRDRSRSGGRVNRSGATAHAGTAKLYAQIKGNAQSSVERGGTVTESFTIYNEHGYIGTGDPDRCARAPISGGVSYEVRAKIDGDTYSRVGDCISVASAFVFARAQDKTLSFTVPGGVSDSFEVKYEFYLPGSGQVFDTISIRYQIEPCENDLECDGDLICENGECVEDTSNGNGNGDDGNGGGDGDECTVDGDCLGQLVCDSGQCVEPLSNGGGGLSSTALLAIGGGGAALLTVVLAAGR